MWKDPALYIIMRTDMASLNPGKAMAQAAHASNAFIWDYRERVFDAHSGVNLINLVEMWQNETKQGFGTTIVLGGFMSDISDTLLEIEKMGIPDNISGLVYDPTYPIRDGDVTHLIGIHTCAYVFCDRTSVSAEILRRFNLHY